MTSEKEETQTAQQSAKDLIKICASYLQSKPVIHPASCHTFDDPAEVQTLRSTLLKWYEEHERPMPWRIPCLQAKLQTNQENYSPLRAYQVWVSEVMLQQTQVSVVEKFYLEWMMRWPTLNSLASATEEQVFKVWAGLGYYSRAKRLLEGAQFVRDTLDGILPNTVEGLLKVKGIGPYTADAIASIAYNQPEALVDGNVVRVLSRLRIVGMNPKSKEAVAMHWDLARKLVDVNRPGHFNQALMDLGATICTPQSPSCQSCPISKMCWANAQKKAALEMKKKIFFGVPAKMKLDKSSLGEKCELCPPLHSIENLDETMYPAKAPKKAAKDQDTIVIMIQVGLEFLLVPGPDKGLLANLYDFPNTVLEAPYDFKSDMSSEFLQSKLGVDIQRLGVTSAKFVGKAIHIFSHIKRTMYVEHFVLSKKPEVSGAHEWVSRSELESSEGCHLGVPATVKKSLSLLSKGKRKTQSEGVKEESTAKKSKELDVVLFNEDAALHSI